MNLLPSVNIMWSKWFWVRPTKSGYQHRLKWYLLVQFIQSIWSWQYKTLKPTAGNILSTFQVHNPVSYYLESCCSVSMWNKSAVAFNVCAKRGMRNCLLVKLILWLYQKRLFIVQWFCHSLAKLLPKVSMTRLNIRMHCSYNRCPIVHRIANSEKLAVIQGCILLLLAKSSD